MPTIDIKKHDLEKLVGTKLAVSALEKHLMLAKAELKGYSAETDDLKIELSDSNRPDLWSAEGVARQIRIALAGKPDKYPFFTQKKKDAPEIIVSREMKKVRPYIAACTVRGVRMTSDVLAQMIQSQEKLSEIFGRKRATVSIGIYELERITFPVSYRLVEPVSISFTPLGMEEKLNMAEILERHSKGIAYGGIVKQFPKYPVLIDSKDQVLSFPPIINSREIGEVKPDTANVLVEVTGTELEMITLTLNILAVNFYDRGARVEPVTVRYPYVTGFGQEVTFPYNISKIISVPLSAFSAGLGEAITAPDVKRKLTAYGHSVNSAATNITVAVPPYRDDIMHPVDLVEDYAISRGYDSFTPVMPQQSTVGALSKLEMLSDVIRTYLIGAGFQEMMSNILCSQEDLDGAVSESEKCVKIDNPMTLAYAVLRNRVLPSLLRVEGASAKAFYPHRTFEVGEIAVFDQAANMGSRTMLNCAALISHQNTNFSEVHSFLDVLLFYLGIEYRLEPAEHSLFMPGRCGKITTKSGDLGFIGEIRPEVLDQRKIAMPCAGFEINVDRILEMKKRDSSLRSE